MHQPILLFFILVLGMASEIKEVEITWPTGEVQRLSTLATNAHYVIRYSEDLKSVAFQSS